MRLKKKYRAGGKMKKPMTYAQNGVVVPSETEGVNTNIKSSPMLYSDIYGPTSYTGLGGSGGSQITREGSPGYLPDIGYSDRFGSGSLFFQGDQQGRTKDRLSMAQGFDQYANLYNRINKDLISPRTGSDTPMTADSLSSLYNNPSELYSMIGEDDGISTRGNNFRKNTFTKKNEQGEEVESYDIRYTLNNDDMKKLDPTREIFDKGDKGIRLGSNQQLVFNSKGEVINVLSDSGTSTGIKLSDDEKNQLNQYFKDQVFENYITQGKSGKDLEKYATNVRGAQIASELETKPLSTTGLDMDAEINKIRNVPSFVEQDDDVVKSYVGPTVEVVDKKDPSKGGMDAYRFDDSDPLGMDDDKTVSSGTEGGGGDTGTVPSSTGGDANAGGSKGKEETTTKETTTGVSVGGKDYDNAEEAKAALKKIPQTQLSDEEYEYLFGKSGMKIPGYKKGGITLKKKKNK